MKIFEIFVVVYTPFQLYWEGKIKHHTLLKLQNKTMSEEDDIYYNSKKKVYTSITYTILNYQKYPDIVYTLTVQKYQTSLIHYDSILIPKYDICNF